MAFSFFSKKPVKKIPGFGFKLPTQTPAPKDIFLAKEKETKAWIQQLPVANVGETARLIFKMLINFNRMEIPFNQRIKSIECFRDSISFVQANLEKHYYNMGMPLTPKAHKISVLTKELNSEMAIAYKIIIDDIITSNKKTFNSKILIIAIHRALEYMATLIYNIYFVYEEVPKGVWHDIHRIYSYAHDNGIAKAKIKSVKGDKISIEDIYIHLNMFVAISPTRLRAKDISTLILALPQWREFFHLSKKTNYKDKTGRFIIDILSDEPVIPATVVDLKEIKKYRVLNARPLIRYLHQYRHTKTKKKTWMSELSPSFLDQLIKSWSHGAKREVERTQFHFELHVTVSLNTLFKHLPHYEAGEEELTEDERLFFEQNSKFNFQHALSDEHHSDFTVSNLDSPVENPLLFNDSVFQASPSFVDSTYQEEAEPNDVFICKTVNESTGGYCISWQGENAPLIKIGEIIGIQAASDKTQFGVAVIRWINHSHSKGLLVGIQLISSSVIASEIIPLAKDKRQAIINHRALLLQPMKSLKRKESLIFSPIPTQKGEQFTLATKKGVATIQLGKMIESSGAFVQFYYHFIDSPEDQQTAEAEKTEGAKSEDFDNVWSSI